MTYGDLHGHGQVLCLWFPGFNVKVNRYIFNF